MKKIISLLGLATVFAFTACNKAKTDMISGTDYKNNPGVSNAKKKVLYLVIDGMRGSTVRSMQTPVLWGMRDSAIYTWAGISDVSGTNGANWAAMLTGVMGAKNGVISDDYTKANLNAYPIFTKRLKDAGLISRSAAFCASPELSQNLIGNNMDVNKVLPTDNEVKSSVITELATDAAEVVFAEFGDVEKTGKQYGYDESVPEYAAAVKSADQNIGEIISALRSRKTYGSEDWLVIVTSNKGGSWPVAAGDDDGTVFSVPLYNSFTFFYNPRFVSAPVARPEKVRVPYEGKAVRMYGDPKTAGAYVRAECNDAGAFNMNGRNMTFECKLKMLKNASGNYSYAYPPFFGKCNARTSATGGWAFFRNGNAISYYVADGSVKSEKASQDLADGNWHSITGTIIVNGANVNTAMYIDGVQVTSDAIPNAKIAGITATANTIIGPFPEVFTTTWLNAYITDVRIFNVALPATVIKTWAERTTISPSHPYYANLIGYWTCMDGSGNKFVDKTPNKRDFNIIGNFTWDAFADQSGYLYPAIPNFERYVPNPVDIPMVILNWMKLPVNLDWQLDAKAWPATFRDFPVVTR